MTRHLKSARPRTAPERLIALLPLVEFFRQRRAGCTVTTVLSDASLPRRSEDIVRDIASRHRVGRSTVWRWYTALKGAGGCAAYVALMRRPRSDRGRARYFENRPYVAE
ncbi:MAG: hypothetical protein WCC59_15125, partial [Terriglobales bacterium]